MESFECSVCLAPNCDGILWNSCPSLFPTSEVLRGVCESCVDSFLISEVDQNEIQGDGCIRCICANSLCEYKFKRDFIVDRLGNLETLSKYERFAANAAIECDPSKKWCPRPGCNSVGNIISSRRALCGNCNLNFCAKCGVDHSKLIDCSMVGLTFKTTVVSSDSSYI